MRPAARGRIARSFAIVAVDRPRSEDIPRRSIVGIPAFPGRRPMQPNQLARWALILLWTCGGLSHEAGAADDSLSFNRDVRPILADKCFHCHGQDEAARQAELRLDDRDSATAQRDGAPAIVPGSAATSELWRRITLSDPGEQMPPPDEPRQLTTAERDILRRWIDEGAEYEAHWAFIAPVRLPPPEVNRTERTRNAIDNFVLASLEQERTGRRSRSCLFAAARLSRSCRAAAEPGGGGVVPGRQRAGRV
jgi:hypothetical protein